MATICGQVESQRMPHLLQLSEFFLEVLTVIIFMTQQKHTSNSKPRQSKQQPRIRTQRSCSQETRKLSPLRSWLNLFWIMWSFAAWIQNSTFLIHKTHHTCVTSYETTQSLPQQQWSNTFKTTVDCMTITQ